jgi:NAD(P)H-quinone oxidoreductase subunit 5
MNDALVSALGICVLAMPALLLAVLGLTSLLFRPLSENAMARWTASCVSGGLVAVLSILALMLASGSRYVPVELGDWVSIPQKHFHFHLKFAFDRLSVPFVVLTFVLVGTIGAFANRYLHREEGYGRFFLSFALFLLGMVVASLAATIETLFLGWELVGLSSALLVAFFHERTTPVVNGQRVWSVYRFSDAAFLLAAVALHHVAGAGAGDFSRLMLAEPWPEGHAALTSQQALWVGLLFLLAAAGKSALIPFSGWLPRAMEGPTPSSAVFYGALSVHLGAFLLLRVSPLLNASHWLSAAVVALGLVSAVFASIAGRVQTDAKGALAFASLTQVGIITVEIGLGLRYIPLIHIIGHACLRTLQLVRAPSLLHDYHSLEDAIGGRLPHEDGAEWVPDRFRRTIYRVGLERGQLDPTLDRFVVQPFVQVFRWCDRMERRWTDFWTGAASRESDRVTADAPIGEEI